jgi:hypothetical protein
MKTSKASKPYEIISDNPKMDTTGMAGKPAPMEDYKYVPPTITIKQMMEIREMKTNKKPEMDS